jgi:uncharacterized protein YbbC (DUF1343 family)
MTDAPASRRPIRWTVFWSLLLAATLAGCPGKNAPDPGAQPAPTPKTGQTGRGPRPTPTPPTGSNPRRPNPTPAPTASTLSVSDLAPTPTPAPTPRIAPTLGPKPAGTVWTGLEVWAEKKESGSLKDKKVGLLLSAPLLNEPLNAASYLGTLEGVELAAVAAAPPVEGVAALAGVDPEKPEAPALAPRLELLSETSPFLSEDFWSDIDALAIDLQLSGLRADPALTILGVALEDAFSHEKKVVLFDRPNPLGGLEVAGPIQDVELYNQPLSYYPMPPRHGLTTAEAAAFINQVFGAGAETEIVQLRDWKRALTWPRTGLPWTAPWPGPASYEALLATFPADAAQALGLEVSGEGAVWTFGAAGVDGQKLVAEIDRALKTAPEGDALAASLRWSPETRPAAEPGSPAWGGAKLEIIDAKTFDPIKVGFAILAGGVRAGLKLDEAQAYGVIGHREALQALRERGNVSAAMSSYEASLQAFQLERLRTLIYKR